MEGLRVAVYESLGDITGAFLHPKKMRPPCQDNPSIIRYLDNKSLIIISLQPLSGEFNP